MEKENIDFGDGEKLVMSSYRLHEGLKFFYREEIKNENNY